MWILGSARNDAALLLAPGFAAALAVQWLAPDSLPYVILAVLVVYLLDAGHVFSTAVRVYLRPARWRDYPGRLRLAYVLTPIVAFVIPFLWIYSGAPFYWTALIYIGFYHHVRQHHGVLRWYQKLNGRFDRWSSRFLHVLFLGPCVIAHFRSDVLYRGHFTGQDLQVMPSPVLWKVGLVLYGAVVAAWLVYERRTWTAGHRELNRFAAVAAPSLLSAVCFLGGRTEATILLPIVVVHTVAYFALIGVSIERTEPRWRLGWAPAMAAVLVLGGVYGVVQFGYEELVMVWEYEAATERLGIALAIGGYSCIVLSHYILDGIIWKSDHPDGEALYRAPLRTAPVG